MTDNETILFWRFLDDKGMRKNYEFFYANHRFDGRDVGAFLAQVPAEDAILTAFDLAAAPNSIFGPKYWLTLNEKWFRRLEEYRADGKMIEAATVICGHCGRVLPRSAFAYTTKGQLHKHCRECESGAWDRQRREQEEKAREKERQEMEVKALEAEIAERKARLDSLSAAAGDTAGTVPAAEPAGTDEKPADDAASRSIPKLGEHDATLHYRPETRKIVFNAVLSAYVHTAGLTKCYLSTDRDGRQFLVFNGAEGANVTWVSTRTSRLAQVCSTAHVRQIAERFRLAAGDIYYLHITRNLSKTPDVINVEVKQVHTREEFAAIAARREEEKAKGRPVPGGDVPEYEDPADAAPLIDFSGEAEPEEQQPEPKPDVRIVTNAAPGQSLMIPLSGRKPADLLQQLVDRNHLTERDIAKFLYDRGWKLQQPVVVKTHKKFKA